MAGAVALGAQVKIFLPFTPVPITLQTLPVLLAPFAVCAYRASAGLLLYACLGVLGAPVFAVTSGATLGYLIGFMAAPMVIQKFRNPAAGILAGTGVIYLLGVAWLILGLHLSPWQALVSGVLPFLPGDFGKAVIAYCGARYLQARAAP
ncbi:MAG: biotin transporter BioY [Candidatus Hydrogenedentes bacterium]|nr:biotin transporter BioY [Candidatus Hydrogenedentota bacterium]